MNLLPKPPHVPWTDEQWKAIHLKGHNILVSAAAGSGKTAVLVERIIQRICAPEDPVDVDRLLVATFTKAAADEMRMRIREALENKLRQNPDSAHLRRQLALIQRASITTLHSFCLEVVQKYYQTAGIDPSFRIADETEAELIREEVLEELLEDYYAESGENSLFWKLADTFGGERNDSALFQLIKELYDFSRSHPWPSWWLAEMAGRFAAESGNSDKLKPWLASMLDDVARELDTAAELLAEALTIAGKPGGPYFYRETVREELQMAQSLRQIAAEQSWERLYEAFQPVEFGKLKPVKGEEIDPDLREQAKLFRDMAKSKITALKESYFVRSLDTFVRELQEIAPMVKLLADLTMQFSDRYGQAKAVKGLVDFSDLEHYCLNILRAPESAPGQFVPSQAALDYRKQFVEVLIDEYQDTNLVQEAIIALITNDHPGNCFMVGDVKQSIYRFRLAEPGLFLSKYLAYRDEPELNGAGRVEGCRIDLNRNFRSRREVVDAVNFIFSQIMNETAGEIRYDDGAKLVYGANYPPVSPGEDASAVELMLIERSRPQADADSGEETEEEAADQDRQEMEAAQLEARLIARKIRQLLGENGEPLQVFDKESKMMRPATYRDIVILLRAAQTWAPVMVEELRLAGIPCYAELNTGYFAAGEVETVLSLLQVIDNPCQDFPLAAVLRSPICQCSAEDLAKVRIFAKDVPFYEAVVTYAQEAEGAENALREKLRRFLRQLEMWRGEARQGSLAGLIWRIYRETGYYDLVGGLPGGAQRQANLRALYDRARQYEATSFRGLFRFLRFVESLRDRGADMGTARALGEQENVVRIMSIHKSKGLEFPVVFLAGLGKPFNVQDLNRPFLMHRQLGFGPQRADLERRVSYPTLAHLAIRRRLKLEMLAEEMRVLYVALTRAKEKLFLLGTVNRLEQKLQTWKLSLSTDRRTLPDYLLLQANNALDWLMPALIRHPRAEPVLSRIKTRADELPAFGDPSLWKFTLFSADGWEQAAPAAEAAAETELLAVRRAEPVRAENDAPREEIHRRLSWTYPFPDAPGFVSKTSVTELKRLSDWNRLHLAGDDPADGANLLDHALPLKKTMLRRPRFMEERSVSPAERGTAVHALLQHLPLDGEVTEEVVARTLKNMAERRLISQPQLEAVDISQVLAFFASGLGHRLLASRRVYREVPFSYGLPAKEIYPHADGETGKETIVIQGVVDCLFAEDDGYVLIDYKTDAVFGHRLQKLRERYRLQIELYTRAVEEILHTAVKEAYLYLFDGAHVLKMK